MQSASFAARANRFAQRAGLLASAIGGLSLIGWIFNVAQLKGLSANITIKANTSIALVMSGAALALLARPLENPRRRTAARVLAVAVGVLGGLTMFEHLSGMDLGMDELLFTEPAGAVATASPNRMGPPAAISFFLCGLAFFLASIERSYALMQVAGAMVLLIGLFGATGYAYGTPALYGVAKYTGIALHTALTLMLLGLGLLAVRVDRGPMAPLSADLASAASARRMLLIGAAGPFILGWLMLEWHRAGGFDFSFGLSAVILAVTVLFAVTVVRQTSRIASYERTAIADATALRQQHARLEQRGALIDLSYEPIFTWDLQGQIRDWNQGCERLYGFSKSQAIGAIAHELLQTRSHVSRADQLTKLRCDNFWAGTVTHVTAGGQPVVVESRQQLVTFEGQPIVLQSDHEVTLLSDAGTR